MRTQIATFTGSSGAGKSSICLEVMRRVPAWKLIPSVTTRERRQKDMPFEYLHVPVEDFLKMETEAHFLWTADAHGHRYGTPLSEVTTALAAPEPSFMLIEPRSVLKLRDFVQQPGPADVLTHFYFCAPSTDELRMRLKRRQGRGDALSDEEIELRLHDCKTWDAQAYASYVPYVFIPGEITIDEAASRVIAVLRTLGGVT